MTDQNDGTALVHLRLRGGPVHPHRAVRRRKARAVDLGFSRIVASEIEVANMLVILV